MCEEHKRLSTYCDYCLLESKKLNAAVLEQYAARADFIWDALKAGRHVMLEAERKYPITGITILAELRYPDDLKKYLDHNNVGPARGELRELFNQLLDLFISLRIHHPRATIGSTTDGFFIYTIPHTEVIKDGG